MLAAGVAADLGFRPLAGLVGQQSASHPSPARAPERLRIGPVDSSHANMATCTLLAASITRTPQLAGAAACLAGAWSCLCRLANAELLGQIECC